jgi:hypothetical protein
MAQQLGEIQFRSADGYLRATDFAGMAKPHFESYVRQRRVRALCAKIENSGLSGEMPAIQTVPHKATWVHPLIAVDWALHCSNVHAAKLVEDTINSHPEYAELRDMCIACVEMKMKVPQCS